jgi:hypothetical protein
MMNRLFRIQRRPYRAWEWAIIGLLVSLRGVASLRALERNRGGFDELGAEQYLIKVTPVF